MRRVFSSCLLVACLLGTAAARAGQPEEDEAALKEAKVATDAGAMAEFFKKRILPEKDTARVKQLIARLSDERFVVREQTTEALIGMGPGIAKALRDASKSPDPEVAYRVKEALEVVERTSTVPMLSAA